MGLLILSTLINCVLAVGIYLLEKYTPIKKWRYSTKQIIIGVLFGGASAFASSFGVEWLGTVVNVRDAAPLSAGLIFGGPSGIIAGCIGGLYRFLSVYWGAGTYTQIACSLATILAGFMAAGVRKWMFDNKKPNWVYGICIAIACEVLHMILIFVTNMGNASYAFEFVKGATLPMIIGNACAVGISLLVISLFNLDRKSKKTEGIANTFQRWLLICIAVAFVATSSFTYILQNGIVKVETQKVFTSAINDVENDVRGKSNAQLLAIVEDVKKDYEQNPSISLDLLVERYQIKEINVVDKDGIIRNSTELDVIDNYNMNSKSQSKEFVDMLKVQDSFVQDYSPRGKDESVWRKYAAMNLANGGFIQVGYDAEQFHAMLNEFVIDVTKNRHVGSGGFVAVCDDKLNIVIDNEYIGKPISAIGINPPSEMLNGKTATTIYTAAVIDGITNASAQYMYVFKFVEGYCIIAAMPETEATFMRDSSVYTAVFMQIIIFATLFVFVYVLVKRVIINNLKKVNNSLGRITGGDLNVTVDVRANQEFASLSDDINSTVSTLKRYIAEAAARIDKELEYAKQIQLSALPTNFPNGEKYEIFAQMIAAKEVGGDFYDFYKLNENTVAFLVADVSGKGIPAAMFMMTAKTIIKDLAENGMPVNEIFTKANQKLCENNESGMFVTAWMGILDLSSGKLAFANAGHNPPLLKRADGKFEYLKARGGFILAGMEGVRYRANEITLNKGDRLFLYTDGVTEATNLDNKLYGEDRLLEFMNDNLDLEATKLLPKIKTNIDDFVGEAPQFDDITMLILDYKAEKEDALVDSKVFPANTQALTDVLAFIEQTLEKYECSMKLQTAICVAIEEVFVNVAHYAYGQSQGDVRLDVAFDRETRIVTFRMVDKGIPFDPLKKPDPNITLSAEEREIGGLGIFITKKTMDQVNYSYENGQNILTMTKKI